MTVTVVLGVLLFVAVVVVGVLLRLLSRAHYEWCVLELSYDCISKDLDEVLGRLKAAELSLKEGKTERE